jgi:ferredoxin
MPHVVFRTSTGAPAVPPEADAPAGGSLGDLCDAVKADIPFSCRSASCATCRIVVLEGADLLLPADDEEANLLDVFAVPASAHLTLRLACQAKLRPGPGRLVIRPVADDEA